MVITRVDAGLVQSISLQPGIREVNGVKIASTGDLAAAVRSGAGSWTLAIERAGRLITARFSG